MAFLSIGAAFATFVWAEYLPAINIGSAKRFDGTSLCEVAKQMVVVEQQEACKQNEREKSQCQDCCIRILPNGSRKLTLPQSTNTLTQAFQILQLGWYGFRQFVPVEQQEFKIGEKTDIRGDWAGQSVVVQIQEHQVAQGTNDIGDCTGKL